MILSSLILVPPIQKCNLSDTNCIKASAQSMVPLFTAGIPELGTEALDPMQVDAIKVELSGLNLDIENVVIKGMRNSVIEKLRLVEIIQIKIAARVSKRLAKLPRWIAIFNLCPRLPQALKHVICKKKRSGLLSPILKHCRNPYRSPDFNFKISKEVASPSSIMRVRNGFLTIFSFTVLIRC